MEALCAELAWSLGCLFLLRRGRGWIAAERAGSRGQRAKAMSHHYSDTLLSSVTVPWTLTLLLQGGVRGWGRRSCDCPQKVGCGDFQAQPASRAEQGPQAMALMVLGPLPRTWTQLGPWHPGITRLQPRRPSWGLDYSPINHQGFRVRPGNLLVCLIRPLH